MKPIDSSSITTANQRAADRQRPVPGFFDAVKNVCVSTRLLTPPGLRMLVLGIIVALFSGFIVIITAEDIAGAATVDLATSTALIALFGFVLGGWLGARIALMTSQLILHALSVLDRRVDKLLEELGQLVGKPIQATTNDGSRRNGIAGYLAGIGAWGYSVGLSASSLMLVILMLRNYTYMDNPSITSDMYILSLQAFSVISALSVLLVSSIIASQWYRISALERRFDLIVSRERIHQLAPRNEEISDSISKANGQVLRLVTGQA